MRNSRLPFKLQRRLVERPWGGEIWFTAEDELPLLIKYIYTHQDLSVQVHPGDEYASQHHNSRGKTEMWHIVRATPEARIALGFREPITTEHLRQAALSGEIRELLNWVRPKPGDTFFTPAGTVHAIGGGIELWEIQENSDITYRLFDYGRGRELHLDQGVAVTNTDRSDPGPVPLPVCCPWFCTDRIEVAGGARYATDPERWQVFMCVRGTGLFGDERWNEGEVWFIPGGVRFEISSREGTGVLLTAWVPAE